MKTFAQRFLFAIFGVLFLVLPLVTLAAYPSNSSTGNPPSNSSAGNPPSNSSVGYPNPSSVTIQNPLGVDDFCGLIVKLLQAVVIIATPIAVLLIVYSGFMFVQARGNPSGIKTAKNNFMWTCIGIAIFFSAWLLAQVIGNTVSSVSGFSFCGNSTTQGSISSPAQRNGY